jgi:hypothetical protein
MKAVLLMAAVLATLAMVFSSPAFAWSAQVSGQAVCDEQTGEFVISWTITSEDEGSGSSRLGEFELPGTVEQSERVPGTTSGPVTLDVHVVFSNEEEQDVSASVELTGDCEAPATTTTTGGTTTDETTGTPTTGTMGGTTGGTTGGSTPVTPQSDLPFTGLPLWIPMLAAVGMLGSGILLLRRRQHN